MSDQTEDVPGSWVHYAAYRAIGKLTAVLPLGVQYTIARLAAGAYCTFDVQARNAVCLNLRGVLGADAAPWVLRRTARSVFQSFGRYLTEFFNFENFSTERFDRIVSVKGREHVENGLKIGRGVLFVSGHYSNWELGPATVAHMGFPVLAVTQMHSHPKINALFVKQRALRGVEIVHSRDAALRAMKALKQNRTVAMLGDRPTGGPTIDVEFFGRTTPFPQGPWRIALRTGAALLPTFVVRQPDGTYVLEIHAPIKIPLYTEPMKSASSLAQAWARCWETRVRSDPTQWEVFNPVWGLMD